MYANSYLCKAHENRNKNWKKSFKMCRDESVGVGAAGYK